METKMKQNETYWKQNAESLCKQNAGRTPRVLPTAHDKLYIFSDKLTKKFNLFLCILKTEYFCARF